LNRTLLFASVGLLASLAGVSLFLAERAASRPEATSPADISPAALMSARFAGADGQPRSLAEFPGKILVVNFWATWCAPCREEIPGFVRLQSRWSGRGVQFVGIAQDEPDKVARFAAEFGIDYPLWTGGSEVMELSRRLGNRLGVMPHTVLIDPRGTVLESRVGIFHEATLESRLGEISIK
jgi:thiol-disulfide isomerase/thioredoxin